jgi:hypothetical protein
MRKLKLTVENLHVETFHPDAAPAAERGTVQARASFMPGSCWPDCSHDTYCADGPCTNIATCLTCVEPHYASQCGGASCYEVC